MALPKSLRDKMDTPPAGTRNAQGERTIPKPPPDVLADLSTLTRDLYGFDASAEFEDHADLRHMLDEVIGAHPDSYGDGLQHAARLLDENYQRRATARDPGEISGWDTRGQDAARRARLPRG